MHYQTLHSPFSWGRRVRFSANPLFSKFKTTLIAAWQNWKFPLRETPKTRNWQINKRARVCYRLVWPPRADLFNIPLWFILKCLILTVQFRRRASDGGANKARRRPRRSIPEVELCAAVCALLLVLMHDGVARFLLSFLGTRKLQLQHIGGVTLLHMR